MVRRTLAALAVSLVLPAAAQATNAPPAQPSSGPGGSQTSWGAPTQVAHNAGTTTPVDDYTTFVPAGWTGAGAAPTTLPVVILLHGANFWEVSDYTSWIHHLTAQGNIVIYPQYQTHVTRPADYTANAIGAIKQGLAWLRSNASPAPDTSSGVTLIGHSYGGVVATNYLGRWSSEGLPKPATMLAVNPWYQTYDASLPNLPSTVKVDCLVGDDDSFAGRGGCDTIWSLTSSLPAASRNYVWMFSDAHGSPALDANHGAPSDALSAPVDALDYYGYWKLGDGLRDCGMFGTNCSYATGQTAQETNMGAWQGDGVPVRPLQVTLGSPACPAGSNAKGC
jgi:pimeloyl-ACP methyl ester carboxylesterase